MLEYPHLSKTPCRLLTPSFLFTESLAESSAECPMGSASGAASLPQAWPHMAALTLDPLLQVCKFSDAPHGSHQLSKPPAPAGCWPLPTPTSCPKPGISLDPTPDLPAPPHSPTSSRKLPASPGSVNEGQWRRRSVPCPSTWEHLDPPSPVAFPLLVLEAPSDVSRLIIPLVGTECELQGGPQIPRGHRTTAEGVLPRTKDLQNQVRNRGPWVARHLLQWLLCRERVSHSSLWCPLVAK